MRARDLYELRREPSPRQGRWWRRLGQLLALVIDQGHLPGGGGRTVIVERATGRDIGEVRQPFGNDFYDVRLQEELLTLSAEDFGDQWLPDADG